MKLLKLIKRKNDILKYLKNKETKSTLLYFAFIRPNSISICCSICDKIFLIASKPVLSHVLSSASDRWDYA